MFSLIISPSAKSQIQSVASQKGDGYFLRLKIESGGCKGFNVIFSFDNNLNDNDLTSDNKLCVVDTDSHNLCQNSTIDFIEELGSSYFKLNNPNSSGSCGCGSSFELDPFA